MSDRAIGMGAGALLLGEMNRADRRVKLAHQEADIAIAQAQTEAERANRAEHDYSQLLFRAQSQVHGFRARIEAHVAVEGDLAAALQTLDPNHPLSDPEVIEYLVDLKRDQLIYSPEVVEKTYLDGKAPEGSIPIIDGEPGVKGGLPAFPLSPEKRAERQMLVKAMEAQNLSFDDVRDPVVVAAAIERQQAKVADLKDLLDKDSKKGLFTSMSKKNRANAEKDRNTAVLHLESLQRAFVDAKKYVEDANVRAEKRARVEEKLKKHGWVLK